MTMQYFDGFDWPGDNTSGTVASDLLDRAWVSSSGLTVEAVDASPMWSGYSFKPIGKMLKLSGGDAEYLSHATRPWIDEGIGINLMFTSVPSGGPHKLIEVCGFYAGTNPRYTLCLLNKKLALYAYGEVGSGAVFEGHPWYLGELQANTLYCVHYYVRRSMRILYVNGKLELLRGGYPGLETFQSVRFHAPVSLYIDDFYNTWTQPAWWPYAYDTLFPYMYINQTTGAWTPHKVLSPKPTDEVDINGAWEVGAGSSVVAAVTGGDDTYLTKNVREEGNFTVGLEDVDFPGTLRAYHFQGLTRCNRQGSLPTLGYSFEGRIPGLELTFDVDELDLRSALEIYWHLDTIAIGNNDTRPSAREFRVEVQNPRTFAKNHSYTSTPEWINRIEWTLVDQKQPDVYSMGI